METADNKNRKDSTINELREKARKVMASLNSQKFTSGSHVDTALLLEELNIYHIELEMQNEELQKSRDKVESALQYQEILFGQAPIGNVIIDRDGEILKVNETFQKYLGFNASVLTGKRFRSFITQNRFLEFNRCWENLFSEKTPQQVEIQMTRSGQPPFWARLDLLLIEEIKGSLEESQVFCSIVDTSVEKKAQDELLLLNATLEERVAERTRKLEEEITVRKQAEEESRNYAKKQTTLLQEIHHRVKNNMQIVVSLLRLQEKNIQNKEARTALNESQLRVKALATIHEILYQADDLARIPFNKYMTQLIKHLSVAYGVSRNDIQININVTSGFLHINQAVPVGLIITEIITNSIKYAFPNGSGKISVSVKPVENNQYELRITDNGVGLPEDYNPKKSSSLGMTLIHRLAEDQLEGHLEIKSGQGTEVTVLFTSQAALMAADSA